MSKEPSKAMGEAQRAYEEKRAAKAGVSMDKWMRQKQRAQAAAHAAAAPAPAQAPKRGLIGRLFGRKG